MRLALIAACASAAGPAAALELSPASRAMLDRGKPYVEVTAAPDGASGVIRAAIDIAAPQETVWQVMTDCSLAPKLAPSLKSCRVLARDSGGRWDILEQVSRRTVLPPVRNVFRQDYDPPNRITFRRTGGDLEVFEGEWRVLPVGQKVRVTYEARVTAPFSVPGWTARMILRQEIPAALAALRRESLARAPKGRRVASSGPSEDP